MELSAEYLREKLQRDLEAEHVEVEDTTPNRCASSFRVLVVSAKFEGKPLLQRHRQRAPHGEPRPQGSRLPRIPVLRPRPSAPLVPRARGPPASWVTLLSGTTTETPAFHFLAPSLPQAGEHVPGRRAPAHSRL
ncbi:bolA-like protein 2 isoform X1 [Canis lupus baileyi]|uniref:bolA-like protein 2 isoform X1 n=1 Tax=Canis lupus dingo TaxID=286419 RepID=UPI000DC6649D|nr:bolA-like protein 2 isoform X1 [Canis lupus dingo]XP_038395842.1 bolA-like protein 2 isoform X1 [Canis lupus familiaris]